MKLFESTRLLARALTFLTLLGSASLCWAESPPITACESVSYRLGGTTVPANGWAFASTRELVEAGNLELSLRDSNGDEVALVKVDEVNDRGVAIDVFAPEAPLTPGEHTLTLSGDACASVSYDATITAVEPIVAPSTLGELANLELSKAWDSDSVTATLELSPAAQPWRDAFVFDSGAAPEDFSLWLQNADTLGFRGTTSCMGTNAPATRLTLSAKLYIDGAAIELSAPAVAVDDVCSAEGRPAAPSGCSAAAGTTTNLSCIECVAAAILLGRRRRRRMTL